LSDAVFVVGDIHGHRDGLVRLLRDAGLLDPAEHWIGGDARLWLLGDLVDRGPDGIGAIELAMRLEREGDVRCLLGNHEALLLGAHRFGSLPAWEDGPAFHDLWLVNGGQLPDLAGFGDEHAAWTARRPAIGREGSWLVLHSDTDRYLEFGSTVAAVNTAVADSLERATPGEHGVLLDRLSDRLVFDDPHRLASLLGTLGGQRVVHGHTPIAIVRTCDPSIVTEPLAYADGLALNVDHCLFGGGPGFITRL
jgi:hypothetical protein